MGATLVSLRPVESRRIGWEDLSLNPIPGYGPEPDQADVSVDSNPSVKTWAKITWKTLLLK